MIIINYYFVVGIIIYDDDSIKSNTALWIGNIGTRRFANQRSG